MRRTLANVHVNKLQNLFDICFQNFRKLSVKYASNNYTVIILTFEKTTLFHSCIVIIHRWILCQQKEPYVANVFLTFDGEFFARAFIERTISRSPQNGFYFRDGVAMGSNKNAAKSMWAKRFYSFRTIWSWYFWHKWNNRSFHVLFRLGKNSRLWLKF